MIFIINLGIPAYAREQTGKQKHLKHIRLDRSSRLSPPRQAIEQTCIERMPVSGIDPRRDDSSVIGRHRDQRYMNRAVLAPISRGERPEQEIVFQVE